MDSNTYVPTSEEIATLQNVLDRKLYNIANVIRPRVTARDIVFEQVPGTFAYSE